MSVDGHDVADDAVVFCVTMTVSISVSIGTRGRGIGGRQWRGSGVETVVVIVQRRRR